MLRGIGKQTVKENWKSVYIRISYDQKSSGWFLLEHGVTAYFDVCK